MSEQSRKSGGELKAFPPNRSLAVTSVTKHSGPQCHRACRLQAETKSLSCFLINNNKKFHQPDTNFFLFFSESASSFSAGPFKAFFGAVIERRGKARLLHLFTDKHRSRSVRHICSSLLVITDRWLLIIFLCGCQESHIALISHGCRHSARMTELDWKAWRWSCASNGVTFRSISSPRV